MNRLNVAIIEDEIPAARLLSSMVRHLRPDWNVTVLPGSVEECVRHFAMNPHPELILLDIQLSDGNSFEFISQAKPTSTIIFTTAYDQYAIRAFSVNSIDYILKPVDEKRLEEAIIKYETLAATPRKEDYLQTILDSLRPGEKKYRTRFLISGIDKLWTLQVSDIAYFYSENRITYAVTHNCQEHAIELPLSKLEEQLDPDRFFRANRQMLLSIESILQVEPYFNGKVSLRVKPSCRTTITVSQEKVAQLKMWLNF